MKFLGLIISLLYSTLIMSQIEVTTITNQFDGSGGLNVGPDGLLYIADFGKSLDNANGTQVWRLDYKNQGTIELFATGLSGASGNDFDSNGNLFQSNIAAGKVSKIDANGNVKTFVSNGISCNVGINVDNDDNLYVCNCCSGNGNTIRKVTPAGISTLFASGPLFSCPNGITRDSEGNLYVSNFGNGSVLKITSSGEVSRLANVPGIPGVTNPSNGHIIYSKKEDVLYVASHGSHKIYRLTLDGKLTVLAGSGQRGNDDGTAKDATFSRPNGLALSISEDTLFVNSSIPITDFGGRPLNPSVVRMITGLRNTDASNDIINTIDGNVYFDIEKSDLLLQMIDINKMNIDLAISDLKGTLILKKKLNIESGQNRINIPTTISTGLYIVSFLSKNGDHFSARFVVSD